MISIKGLRHTYDLGEGKTLVALDGIDLEIAEGEFVAVIGANGCGKSTLARHLNCLLVPDDGQVMVDGMDVADEKNLWAVRQCVGMVFQNPDNQIVASVVEEDVAFGPENMGLPSVEICQRVNSALMAVGMTEYAKHAPHLLSGGQKQRLAIAGVLAMEPKYLVLDEPTAMLDPQGRAEVMRTVKKLNKEKKISVIYITHFMSEALAADTVVVMNQGKIVMQGAPSDIFSQVAKLENLALDTPLAARIAQQLRKKGFVVDSNVITNEGLADVLCP